MQKKESGFQFFTPKTLRAGAYSDFWQCVNKTVIKRYIYEKLRVIFEILHY